MDAGQYLGRCPPHRADHVHRLYQVIPVVNYLSVHGYSYTSNSLPGSQFMVVPAAHYLLSSTWLYLLYTSCQQFMVIPVVQYLLASSWLYPQYTTVSSSWQYTTCQPVYGYTRNTLPVSQFMVVLVVHYRQPVHGYTCYILAVSSSWLYPQYSTVSQFMVIPVVHYRQPVYGCTRSTLPDIQFMVVLVVHYHQPVHGCTRSTLPDIQIVSL